MSSENKSQQGKGSQPSVGRLAIPVWMFIVALLLGYRGCMHVDHVGGGMAFRSDIFAPYRTPKEVEGLQPSVDDGGLGKGAVLYGTYCSGCHQPAGTGTPGVFPPLAGSDWVLAEGPNRIARVVMFGLAGPVTVAGKSFNNSMPGLGMALNDEQIAQILTYIRGSKEWGNKASIVTPAEIAAIRDAEKARPGDKQYTQSEVDAIPVK